VNASIATEFSTACFRVGHTLLSPQLLLARRRDVIGDVPLRDAFFNPDFLKDDPARVDQLLLGLAYQPAQEIDNKIVDDVRNFLFGPPGAGGLDLASLNIQRGRDHGLPDYNSVRVAYGLTPVSDFDDISSDPATQAALASVYPDVDHIDPWVGALAEDHIDHYTSVGPLVAAVLRDQFERVRDGDRFYWIRDPDLKHPRFTKIISVWTVRLSDVIRWNTGTGNRQVPRDVFHVEGGGPQQVAQE
jgi:hypothetical protein